MSLASRWLDLDRIAGASEGAGPLDSIIPLAIGLRDLLPAESRSRASFTIDQANIGREAVSGLRLSLVRTDDKLEIEELRLGMPGGSRGELQGVVSGPPDAPVFEGSIGLRGTSLVRFLGWATAGAVPFDAKGDGTFGVRVAAVDRRRARGRAQHRRRPVRHGDLGGRAIPLGGPAGAVARLEGPQLDARAFMPAGASLGDIFDVVLHGPLDAARPRRTGLGAGQARLARRADRRPHPRQRRAADHRRAHLSRRGHGDRAQGRPAAPAAAAHGGRRGLQPRARGRGGRCRLAPKGSIRGVVGADTGARDRSAGRAARRPRGVPPGRPARAGHGAAAPGRIDGVRRAHADLRRSGRSTARPTVPASSSTPASTAARPAGARAPPT